MINCLYIFHFYLFEYIYLTNVITIVIYSLYLLDDCFIYVNNNFKY